MRSVMASSYGGMGLSWVLLHFPNKHNKESPSQTCIVIAISGRTWGVFVRKRELTWHLLRLPFHKILVPSARAPYSFVCGGQRDDGEEREQQPRCAADVPPFEHDAEVCRVPGEEHLRGRLDSF